MNDTGRGPGIVEVAVGATTTAFRFPPAGHTAEPSTVTVAVGPDVLERGPLAGPADPPPAADLTNALGVVNDHVDDVLIVRPDLATLDVVISGDGLWHLVAVEAGHHVDAPEVTLKRSDIEEVFRTVATERRADRLHNPGLEPERVDSIVAVCCVVLGLLRRLQRDDVVVVRAPGDAVDGADR